ncbi:MAG: hypothetical protein Q8K63_12920 [Acidimicrobiales bacterium]|nr:hypothetical protein [Acidimicrobiales bacterium]
MDDPIVTGRAGLPTWVRNTLLVIGALVVVMLVVMVFAGGDHSPGRHMGIVSLGSVAADYV